MRVLYGMVLAALSLGAAAHAATFEQVFSVKGEPAATHFVATYMAAGTEHQLEVWRDARHVRRHTDERSDTVAVRQGEGYRMAVLDLQKKIRTDIDRDNLYRIGNFTDWYDLGHGLRHPKGEYQLTPASAPAGAPAAITACNWFDLQQGGHVTHVCWSGKSKLPLLMVADDGRVVWRVTSFEHKAIKPSVFVLNDAGFIRNDANRDIEQD
jgi:hypothetical protein